MCRTQMLDVGRANIFASWRTFPANNEYRRGDAELVNPMHPGSANMFVAPRREMFERQKYPLIGEYYLETTNVDVGMPNC